ncbi:hypothetical protein HanPI659440_Chr03g0097491 [Helianthus annuus]|nr:hypothetical protein HanPI659440_Chr03g0097491 [Helianthus annuus]
MHILVVVYICSEYDATRAYAISKLANVLHTKELTRRLELFKMVLELSLARLKAFAEFVFGMGLSQGVQSTLAFIAFELPPNGAIGTRILEFLFRSRSNMVIDRQKY